MTEYKDTLNLPETAFAMKANLPQKEPVLLAQWAEQGRYQQIRQARQQAKKFVLHDGPPYANGHLHCGHALNKILKDIIVKSKTLSGYDAPFVPGWDCHGLPIELNVEKKFGKAGHKISAEDFRRKCREYAASQIEIQKQEFKRLGVSGDWDNPYATYDYHYEANIIRALGKVIENGHLEQGFKPVHWCVDCGSALAEAEVDYEDKTSHSIDVAFYAVDRQQFLAPWAITDVKKPVIVPIWTTTPWTLPANEAVCLHPTLQYVLLETPHYYLLVVEERVDALIAQYQLEVTRQFDGVPGGSLEGLQLEHPFQARQVPIVLGNHVTTDSGTGCVHTAPAHGPDDYLVGLKYQLNWVNPVLANGCYAPDVPIFAGQYVLKTNEAIIALLQERNRLLFQTTIQHSYPHCWRHKTPMIFLATPQWFIAMDKNGLRKAIAAAIEKVQWIPEWGKARILSMVETRPDWCISRQRAWGTPMPLFVHKVTRALHPRTLQLLETVAQSIEQKGIEVWFDMDIASLLGDDASEYEKITDTLDVWFDSGVSHYAVLAQRSDLLEPADMYLEGSDQHRGWFNSSLTTAIAISGHPPYKTVLTHGYTVDAEGKKLSKSKGNYVSLDKLIQQQGADILRLWVSSTDYRHEVSISEEILRRNADAYRRIRNTARFLLANLFDFSPATDQVSLENMAELDRYILQRAQQLQQEIIQAYEEYQFHSIYQKIHNFCAVDLGSFYLDVIKDRQYTAAQSSIARRSCQTTMYYIIQALTRWLFPILSFTADEIWQYIPGQAEAADPLYLSTWYTDWPLVIHVDMEKWQLLQAIRDEVNKALEIQRQAGVIGSALAAHVNLYVQGAAEEAIASLGEELRFLLITSGAKVYPLDEAPAEAYRSEALPLVIWVEASGNEKCARCWHRCEDVGTDTAHPLLCKRCIGNIGQNPEVRDYA